MKTTLAFTTLLAISTANAAVPSWPQFRGPNSSGVAETAKPPVEFGPNTNLLWKTPVPSGVSSPCLWGDHIFLTAAEDGKLLTLAVDRRNGKILWRQATAGEKPRELHKQNHPAAATPATDGRSVCVYHATLGLIGYDFNGRFALKPSSQGTLTTNQIAWKHRKGAASISSPLFYRGQIYTAQDGGRITCIQAQGGEKLYEQERLGADGEYYASPVAANGHLYFSSSKGTVTVTEAGETLKVKARNVLGEPIFATPAIADDNLYVRTAEHLWAFGSK